MQNPNESIVAIAFSMFAPSFDIGACTLASKPSMLQEVNYD